MRRGSLDTVSGVDGICVGIRAVLHAFGLSACGSLQKAGIAAVFGIRSQSSFALREWNAGQPSP
jgi:hypothetical protein